jgi:release factor glutamine methyltransferase
MPVKREREYLIRDKYGGEEKPSLKKDLERLDGGEPLAYVIGWVPFLNLKVDLRYRPLIPRAETEFWTEQAIKRIGRKKLRVLDMFCGSGCIGIAVLRNCPNTHMTFADRDPKAVRQTKFNLKMNGISSDRYMVIRSDIWQKVRGQFDVILANPPYIPVSRKKKLSRSVTAFEPHLALFGGEKGTAVLEKFLQNARVHLEPKATIFMEFDSPALKRVKKLAENNGYACIFHKDQFGRHRHAELVSKVRE